MNNLQIIAIVGATASGKTALAIDLARMLDTEIISADSRQFYCELPIGSAMPTAEELASVKHHFISCRSVTEEYAAGAFARDARKVIDELLPYNKPVIVCGGSGLYIQALLYGMDQFPEVSETVKQSVENLYQNKGIEGLQNELKTLDALYFSEVDIYNPARLRRALEVCLSSGKPYSSFRSNTEKHIYNFKAFGLDLPKKTLHERIETRVDKMILSGLENEARNVYQHKELKSLQTVGYKEFFDYFDGNIAQKECAELIKIHTRQYAKRQLTWFRRQLDVEWISEENSVDIILEKITNYAAPAAPPAS